MIKKHVTLYWHIRFDLTLTKLVFSTCVCVTLYNVCVAVTGSAKELRRNLKKVGELQGWIHFVNTTYLGSYLVYMQTLCIVHTVAVHTYSSCTYIQ